ncbi:MAG: hypothetical protein ACRC1K_19050 [Planctomycetia bacterium]
MDQEVALHRSADGLIGVPYLAGYEWPLDEQCGMEIGDHLTTVVRCRWNRPDRFFFMIAKQYVVKPDEVVDAETLLKTVYADGYRRSFPKIQYDLVHTVPKQGVAWVEAAMQMHHPTKGLVAKLERVYCIGAEVLVVSMEGRVLDVKAAFNNGHRWMDETRFARLGWTGQGDDRETDEFPPVKTPASPAPVA